ncbi:energy-coupling factor ABC transporter ATP-binding protein [Chrysiogenes arsenatis]|uniref:energy-coupling factor ABC transporter ATP-binding protein n=1 Tax=Chrysiogenes arsenatis TaxID=309797 RepID=UPI00041B5992|nr:ABC transporter ATP-binding protein [Chrysiogenes arsenatis]
MKHPLLHFSHVSFSYPDTPDAVGDFSLTVHEGEKVGIIGPNGAGKSTLFLLASGVLAPQKGILQFQGKPLMAGKFNSDLALIFQHSDDQLFCPTVWEDVEFGPSNMGLAPEAARQRVERALQITSTAHLAAKAVHHLSEGQKRMVAIAGALAMEPQLVLYDEPSASLDMRSRRQLIGLLQHAPHAMLIASHDLELILEVCPRVVLIDAGKVMADGAAATILGNAELMQAHGQEKPHSLVPHQIPHHHHG